MQVMQSNERDLTMHIICSKETLPPLLFFNETCWFSA